MLILLLQNKLEEVNNSVLPLSLTKNVNQGYSCFDLCSSTFGKYFPDSDLLPLERSD